MTSSPSVPSVTTPGVASIVGSRPKQVLAAVADGTAMTRLAAMSVIVASTVPVWRSG